MPNTSSSNTAYSPNNYSPIPPNFSQGSNTGQYWDVTLWYGRNTTTRDAFYVLASFQQGGGPPLVIRAYGKGNWTGNNGAIGPLNGSWRQVKAEKIGKGYETVFDGQLGLKVNTNISGSTALLMSAYQAYQGILPPHLDDKDAVVSTVPDVIKAQYETIIGGDFRTEEGVVNIAKAIAEIKQVIRATEDDLEKMRELVAMGEELIT